MELILKMFLDIFKQKIQKYYQCNKLSFYVFIGFIIYTIILYIIDQIFIAGSCQTSSIEGTIISVSFTLLGFAITTKNILISRYSQFFSRVPFKFIFDNNQNNIYLICWKIIAYTPFCIITLYILGCKRLLIIPMFFSAIVFLLYFFFTYKMISGREKAKNTIANLLLENTLLDENSEVKITRKSLLGKLCSDNNLNITNSDYISTFRTYISFTQNVFLNDNIQNNDKLKEQSKIMLYAIKIFEKLKKFFLYSEVKKRIDYKLETDDEAKTKISENIIFYTFDYFNYTFKTNYMDSRKIPAIYDEQFNIEYIIQSIIILFNTGLYNAQKNNLKSFSDDSFSNFMKTLSFKYYINGMFGLMLACIINLNFSNFKKIISFLNENLKCVKEDDDACTETGKLLELYIAPYISVMVCLAIYYAIINNYICDNPTIKEVREYYKENLNKSCLRNFEKIQEMINLSFTITNDEKTIISIIQETKKHLDFSYNNPLFFE